MSAETLTEEQRARRWRQRLWGATILIAVAVIVLPLLLDGSGSESQFRRVESLRQEPTRVINADGSSQIIPVPESTPAESVAKAPRQRPEGFLQRLKRRFTEKPKQDADARRSVPSDAPEAVVKPSPDPVRASGQYPAPKTEPPINAEAPNTNTNADSRAWVVQAGSFREEANALAVRDRLRRDGYPSFVTISNDGAVFRVRVGPMVNKAQASNVQENVMQLLGREAIVMPYP